jgi:NADH:ubiquinone oxidoreductase subunit 6 (subunit J)
MPAVVFFYFFGALALLAAVMVVVAKRIFHSALWLALCLLCVAGLFGLMGADFLAAVQVLIYAGAVVSLLLFAVMLTQRWVGGQAQQHLTKHGVLPMVGSIVMLAVLVHLSRAGFPSIRSDTLPDLGPTTAAVGEQLLTTYLVPFEVASVLLVMAMIAAIVLARRDPEP